MVFLLVANSGALLEGKAGSELSCSTCKSSCKSRRLLSRARELLCALLTDSVNLCGRCGCREDGAEGSSGDRVGARDALRELARTGVSEGSALESTPLLALCGSVAAGWVGLLLSALPGRSPPCDPAKWACTSKMWVSASASLPSMATGDIVLANRRQLPTPL